MVPEDNTVRAIDQFVNGLDMEALGFESLPSQGDPPTLLQTCSNSTFMVI